MERHVLAKAQQSLRPELYARITEKLVFNRLSYDVQLEIARAMLARELEFLRGRGFVIGIEKVHPLSGAYMGFIRASAPGQCAMRSRNS